MRIDSGLVKKLRAAQPWTQEQLGEACGLDLRTIQRIESSGRASQESVKMLAAAFAIDPNELMIAEEKPVTPFEAVKTGFSKFSDFSGRATRAEYWWFLLFALLISALAAIINDKLLQVVSVILLVPLLAAGTRRLHDVEQSGWWQLLFLVPFGFIPMFILLGLESKDDSNRSSAVYQP